VNVIEQLIAFHRKEKWHQKELSDADLTLYFESVLRKGRLLLCQDSNGNVLGYCESWRITFEQLGRILCGESFSAVHENINDGNIAYVANAHIAQEHRDSWVYKYLRSQFFKQNFMCTHFVGEARRKKSEPFKCFKRSEFISKYMKEEVIANGSN